MAFLYVWEYIEVASHFRKEEFHFCSPHLSVSGTDKCWDISPFVGSVVSNLLVRFQTQMRASTFLQGEMGLGFTGTRLVPFGSTSTSVQPTFGTNPWINNRLLRRYASYGRQDFSMFMVRLECVFIYGFFDLLVLGAYVQQSPLPTSLPFGE